MARLSEETLKRGRELVETRDLGGFMDWNSGNCPNLDPVVVRALFLSLMEDGAHLDRALMLFDRYYPTYDAPGSKTWQKIKDWADRVTLASGVFLFAIILRVLPRRLVSRGHRR